MIIFEVSIVFIISMLIAPLLLTKMFVDYVISQLVYFLIGIVIILSFISICIFISKCKKNNNRFGYICGVFFAIIFIPYIFLIMETITLDKSNYFLSQFQLSLELKLMVSCSLSSLIFIVPLFISLFSKNRINKILPSIFLFIVLFMFYVNCAITCINSYKTYENNNLGDYKNNSTFVINSNCKIYCQGESPKFVYPLISPVKWSIGEFDNGEKVYLISRNELFDYYDYVEVTNGEKTGYIKKNFLTFENKDIN